MYLNIILYFAKNQQKIEANQHKIKANDKFNLTFLDNLDISKEFSTIPPRYTKIADNKSS